ALKRFGLVGALALGRDGLEWGLGRYTGRARPEAGQHDAQPEQDEDHQLIVHQVWNHGIAPLHSGVIGAFYRILESGELSAAQRYTTVASVPPCGFVAARMLVTRSRPAGPMRPSSCAESCDPTCWRSSTSPTTPTMSRMSGASDKAV